MRILSEIKLGHILVFAACLYALGLNGRMSTAGDDATYVLTARSFLENGVFRQIFSPEFLETHYFYFLFPLLLTPLAAAGQGSFLIMKLLPLASAVAFLWALYMLLEGAVPEKTRKLTVIICAVNPWIVEYSNLIMTDVPYLFISTVSLLSMKRYFERPSPAAYVLMVFLSAISFYTRPAGLAVIAAMFISLAFYRKWRECALAVVIVLIMMYPLIADGFRPIAGQYRVLVEKEDHYSSAHETAGVGDRLYRAAYYSLVYAGSYLPDLVARPISERIHPRLKSGDLNPVFFVKFLFGIGLCGGIIAGFTAGLRSGYKPYQTYFPALFLMMLTVNVYVARYLMALLPMIALFLVLGLDELKHIRRFSTVMVASLLALSLAGSFMQLYILRTGLTSPEKRRFIECNEWVRNNVPSGSVVLSRKPSYTELVTGRKSVGWLNSDNPERQLEYITANGVDYVIIGDLGFYIDVEPQMTRTVARYKDRFELCYVTGGKPENFVYRVSR